MAGALYGTFTGEFLGGKFSITIGTDSVEIVDRLTETVTTLAALYVGYKLFKPLIETAVKTGLGGERDDQDVKDIKEGSLHVQLHCFTDERFLEVLTDYESGMMKDRLQAEFSQAGIKVEGLKVEIENMVEVNKTKTSIYRRHRFSIENIRDTGPRYSPQQLNWFKFALIVLDEIPKAMRQVFKTMWNNKFPAQLWDDSVAVRNQLHRLERHSGHSPKIPTGKSYEEWDCTELFQATIFASTFTDPATGQTLYDKYLRSSVAPPDLFRPTVTSSSGVQDETFALAIDQLRLLRNEIVHSCKTNVLDNATFHVYIEYAMMAFTALYYNTSKTDYINKLPESKFPIANIDELEKRIKEMQSDKNRFSYTAGIQTALLLAILLAIIAIIVAITQP